MIRIINCVDEYGNPYQLKGIKHDYISEFEILLPINYKIIYGGLEWYGANHNGIDLEENILFDPSFTGKITIVNLNPRPVPYRIFCGDNHRDIELFKYLTANCSIINILLDKNKYNRLANTVIRYETNNPNRIDPRYNDEEIASIFDEDFPKDYFARIYY